MTQSNNVQMKAEAIGSLKQPQATVLGFTNISRRPESIDSSGRDAYVSMISCPLDSELTPLFSESEESWVDASILPLYRIRALWKLGEPVGVRPGCASYTINFDATNLSEKTRFLGDIQHLSYLFDGKTNKAFLSLQGMQLIDLEASVGNINKRCYIPCSEVLSFYWRSSFLIKQALSGENASKTLFNSHYSKLRESPPYIQLRKEAQDSLKFHIARIAMCEFANQQFHKIHPNTFFDVNRHPKFGSSIWAVPPVKGRVNWRVEAYPMQSGLYISRILTCDADFPFDELIFGRDNIGGNKNDDTGPLEEKPKPPRRRKATSRTRVAANRRPESDLLSGDCSLEELETLFPKLSEKSTRKLPRRDMEGEGSKGARNEKKPLGRVSTLDPSGQEGNKGSGVAKSNTVPKDKGFDEIHSVRNACDFDSFRAMIRMLGEVTDSIRFLVMDSHSLQPPFGDENIFDPVVFGRIPRWLYLPKSQRGENVSLSIKPFIIAEVCVKGMTLYVVEFYLVGKIRIATLVFTKNGEPIEDDELTSELLSYALNRSDWFTKQDSLCKKKLTHVNHELPKDRVVRLNRLILEIADSM